MIAGLLKCADRARSQADGLPSLASQPLRICMLALMLIGFVARLSPLFDPDARLFWQYLTEDGYLMQTVARNMAIGLGMSTAEGTIPTNGVQPLATFFFAAMHFLASGARQGGIALVTVFSTLVSAGAAYCLYEVGARIFASLRHGRGLAIISAGLWFAAPRMLGHSMNGLETGVYYLAILLTLNYYLAAVSDGSQALEWRQRLALGLLLGITFLARNDAIFFIGGLLFAHLVLGDAKAGRGYRHRLIDCLVAGVTSLVIAAPWLVNNYAMFGSIVPISGLAESHMASLGQNLAYIPANLFEAAFLFMPVPRSLETSVPVILIAIIAVAASLTGFWFFVAKLTLTSRRFFLGGLIFVTGISLYYGIFFGAPHFIRRYTSSLSPFLWLATTATAFFLLNLLFRKSEGVQRAALAITAVLILEATAFASTDFVHGRSHPHRQVVEWVHRNVPASQWVGAVQTGTLGFFHERTINLDGKVNSDALRARVEEGHVLDYVERSRINYLVDWAGITDWVERKESPRFSEKFVIVVKDERLNLGVLRRVQPVE